MRSRSPARCSPELDGGNAAPSDHHDVDDLPCLEFEEAAAIFGELGRLDPP